MAIEDVAGTAEAKGSARNRWVAVYIGCLAVLLAICAVGASNAAKEATGKNIEAANIWAFFQAKNLRRHTLRLQIDELEVLLATEPALSDGARAAIGERIAQYRRQDAQLTTDPASGEGLDELFHKGKALEARRDQALERDPYFDYGQALLQIAIVLASVAIVSGGNMLLTASGLLGLVGSLLTLNGFLMIWKLPFIG